MKKTGEEYDFLKLLDRFISDTRKGKRFQKNGKRIRASSLEPYIWLRKSLYEFSIKKQFPLRIKSITRLGKRQLNSEKKYWKLFYLQFTEYLYADCNCYDNYVGTNIKRLRAFFNYLNEEKEMNIGIFHKGFYACSEEIEIITLQPEQLNFLIYDSTFELSLPDYLQKTKDMFVFGCTVALRLSDIFNLSFQNVEVINNRHYLNVTSQKTSTFTRVLLPDYAVDIISKYKGINKKSVFPKISNGRFNLNVKSLIEKTNWTDIRNKTRNRRGQPVIIYKNEVTKEMYRFCDLVTSHTMRRTAITTMLCLGMPENAVRKISGHAPNSKEFFKYVQLSQKYMDTEAERVFDQLKERKLIVN